MYATVRPFRIIFIVRDWENIYSELFAIIIWIGQVESSSKYLSSTSQCFIIGASEWTQVWLELETFFLLKNNFPELSRYRRRNSNSDIQSYQDGQHNSVNPKNVLIVLIILQNNRGMNVLNFLCSHSCPRTNRAVSPTRWRYQSQV